MVRVVTEYVCEICDRRFSSREEAEACEALKSLDTIDMPPVGLIVEHGAWPEFIAVVSVIRPYREGRPLSKNHYYFVDVWWFRPGGPENDDDNALGDGRPWILPGRSDSHSDKDPSAWRKRYKTPSRCPAFHRAVALCRERGITPTELVDGGLVAIE